MMKKLEFRDLKTIEMLETEGPRNITKVARKLRMPAETLRKRVRRMASRFSWNFHLNIYHTSLGLKKATVIAQAFPGYEQVLLDALKANDFWLYTNRYYGMNEGCLAVYTIPVNHASDFEVFAHRLEEAGLAKQVQVMWSTCFHYVHFTSNWYDKSSSAWKFQWDEWSKETQKKGAVELPRTLRDPDEFPIKADRSDLLILKEMEKNPLVRMTYLAKKIGMSQQLAAYHYLRHIQEQELIESFEISFPFFEKASSDKFMFVLEFEGHDKLARFATSLLDKPFARGLGKVLGKSTLLAHLYLPRAEFRQFVDRLSGMIRTGQLKTYNYLILDPTRGERQTISYEHFENKKWHYDHEKSIKNLEKLAKAQRPKVAA